jgi:hypothetical protein
MVHLTRMGPDPDLTQILSGNEYVSHPTEGRSNLSLQREPQVYEKSWEAPLRYRSALSFKASWHSLAAVST